MLNRILVCEKIEGLIKAIYYIEYINVYDKLVDGEVLNEEYSDDGLHLNDNGYEVVTDILKKYI